MKHREYIVTGSVDKKGNLLIADMARMNDFFSQWKGTKVIGAFVVSEPESSHAIRGYYFNKIVPDVRNARLEAGERHTQAITEAWLRSLSPIMWDETPDEDTGEYSARLREIKELSNQEMVHYIEDIRQIMAENYCLVFDDPNSL